MHNIIAQSTIERSKVWSKGDPALRLLYLTKNLRIAFCKDTGQETLQMISNPEDKFCLHNLDKNEIENEPAYDEEDVNEFRRITSRLRREVLEI